MTTEPEVVYLTVLEASERMGVARTTLGRWLGRGTFPSLRIGDSPKAHRRIAVADVETWLEHDGDPPPEAYTRKPRPEPQNPLAGVAGFIYWIGEPEGETPIKVGFATNVERRLGGIQTGYWRELAILGAIPGTMADEQALQHALAFAGHYVRGEWFERGPALALLEQRRAEWVE